MTTKQNYTLYKFLLRRDVRVPFHVSAKDSHTNKNYHLDHGNAAPFHIILKRGNRISFCAGNIEDESLDISFSQHPNKALFFRTIPGCFYYLRLKFYNEQFIEDMINTDQFQIWDSTALSRYALQSSIARVSSNMGEPDRVTVRPGRVKTQKIGQLTHKN